MDSAPKVAKSSSETELPVVSDKESARYARYTIADALAPPPHRITTYTSDESDCESIDKALREEVKQAPISITSREVIRKYFTEASPICLPQGHPTAVFNQNQMCLILKDVVDDRARSSFEILNSVMLKSSQLNLGQSHGGSGQMHRPRSVETAVTDSETRYFCHDRIQQGKTNP